ncbi:ABC transporter substrate-binding protein [Dethiosulfatarculus sandiegensis]|uniref:ABC transporter substrate-binding protein n=1 Tax=Dethiosulfatarculus sandiegensis TaxID=1429043 RepID=UPI000695D9B9|nr:extracellular solute-binding protein [Dethiosulfatarculus sandiegensis]
MQRSLGEKNRFKKWTSAFWGMFILLVCLTTGLNALAAASEISFWTTEVEKDRLTVQKNLARDFEKKSGIKVKIIPVQENRLNQRVTAAFAARKLPDVMYHPLDYTMGWAESGILNPKAAEEVITKLDKATFAQGPLEMVKTQKGHAAIPLDGWGQLLLYRKDLFKEKNLDRPDSWDKILKAAKALHNPPLLWGFEVATDPGQAYTQQVFEHIALSGGVRLLDKSGRIDLNTKAMINALDFYKELAQFTPPGNLYWLHTRMDYLSGRAAMIVWSPFILDELSGLRRDQPVAPDLAQGKPGFLAKNTGFVTSIQSSGGKAQYGMVNYLGITADAQTKPARAWVEYLLQEGYTKWLAMAPEGKLPLRKGTPQDADAFIKAWKELEFGVTRRAKISSFYGPETVSAILKGADDFDRWGFKAGKGYLMAQIYGSKLIARVLKQFLDGELTAPQAAALMDQKVKELNK